MQVQGSVLIFVRNGIVLALRWSSKFWQMSLVM